MKTIDAPPARAMTSQFRRIASGSVGGASAAAVGVTGYGLLASPGYVFLFFCGMMVLQLLWMRTMVPETKGVPLEEIQKRLGVEA